MCRGGTWKREVVPDHKFDFVDTREFTDNGCGMRMKYLWLYVGIIISFLVYISDIFTAVTMLTTTTWSNEIFNSCPPEHDNGCVYIPFDIGRWLFFGCVVASFLLLAYEAYKAKKIIQSRDISYAFTNVMANNYYSLRSYDHFCLFSHISASTKRVDKYAFFVFFTFKNWKRLVFADGPRQSINALTLYGFYLSKQGEGNWYDIGKYFNRDSYITSALTVSTAFTVLIFIISLLSLICAGICYIPLLFHIQGNLKEYCCHKVDKRISEIIKRRNKQRVAKAAVLAKKEAAGDFSHLKSGKALPQPTLPNVSLDDDDKSSIRTRGPAPSTTAPSYYTYNKSAAPSEYGDYNAADYPPMPAYAQGYHQYNGSVGTLPETQAQYDDDQYSVAHLTSSAAPFAHSDHFSAMQHNAYGYETDGYRSGSAAPDAYRAAQGAYRTGSAAPDAYRAGSTAPDYRAGSTAPDAYRAGSTAPDAYRAGSTAPDAYRAGSTAPDYRSASTAPYGHGAYAQQQTGYQAYSDGQYGAYHQDQSYSNAYAQGAPQTRGQQQAHDAYGQGYYQQERISDGYTYDGGHAQAM